MRIAFDYQTFVLQSYGGISRYFTQLNQCLLNMEQQVGIFAPMHRNSYLASLPRGIVHGWYTKQYPPKTTKIILLYNQLMAHSKIAKWKPDVMHETYYSKTGTAPNSCPTVITV